jgi:hypothetical protein
MTIGNIVGSLGRGLAAGLVGTGVMTLVQTLTMKARHEEGSTTPAEAAETVLDVEPEDARAEQRLNQLTHFAYGTSWGLARGLLGGAGLRPSVANALHFAIVWTAGLAALPRLGLAPPVREWPGKQLVKDVAFHAVYAVATGAAFEWLERRSTRALPPPSAAASASTSSAASSASRPAASAP